MLPILNASPKRSLQPGNSKNATTIVVPVGKTEKLRSDLVSLPRMHRNDRIIPSAAAEGVHFRSRAEFWALKRNQ